MPLFMGLTVFYVLLPLSLVKNRGWNAFLPTKKGLKVIYSKSLKFMVELEGIEPTTS